MRAPVSAADEPREVRLVADEQQRGAVAVRGEQLGGVARVEAPGERLVHDRHAAELGARQQRRVARTHARARVDRLEAHAQARQRPPGGARLALARARSARAVEIVARPVRLGVAVPQQPDDPCHACEPIAWTR